MRRNRSSRKSLLGRVARVLAVQRILQAVTPAQPQLSAGVAEPGQRNWEHPAYLNSVEVYVASWADAGVLVRVWSEWRRGGFDEELGDWGDEPTGGQPSTPRGPRPVSPGGWSGLVAGNHRLVGLLRASFGRGHPWIDNVLLSRSRLVNNRPLAVLSHADEGARKGRARVTTPFYQGWAARSSTSRRPDLVLVQQTPFVAPTAPGFREMRRHEDHVCPDLFLVRTDPRGSHVCCHPRTRPTLDTINEGVCNATQAAA